jgi:uncharacterized protein
MVLSVIVRCESILPEYAETWKRRPVVVPDGVTWTEETGGVSFAVYVTPRAGRTEIAGQRDGALWIRLAAPPVDGKANAALMELLSKQLGVPKASITLVSGATGRTKRIRVSGVTAGDVRQRLAD